LERVHALKIYGDLRSGDCLKVKWTAEFLGRRFQWIETDIMRDETRTPAFLAQNPAGQVPLVILDDGRPLAQSNAIILHLAEGSALIPSDAYDRARMLEWMFWEQYSHEPYIAVARFQVVYLAKPIAELEARIVERGTSALRRMEAALTHSTFLVGERLSVADVALVAYTRVCHEGGFDLGFYPAVRAWVGRVERALKIA
jgi:glutathione S-transferase